MKKGCAVLLLFWAVAAAGYWWLLQTIPLPHPVPWSLGLGLLSMVVLANVFGLGLSLKRVAALNHKPGDWKDGQMVAASGRLTAHRDVLVAPLSGQPAVIFSIEVKRQTRVTHNHKTSTRTETTAVGMGMVACEVRSLYGSARLTGFPLLAEVPGQTLDDLPSRQRLARWLLAHPPQPYAAGLGARMAQINQVFSDQDGELLSAFYDPDGPFAEVLSRARELQLSAGAHSAEAVLSNWFDQEACTLSEKRLAPNVEVCAFGECQAQRRELNVGSGMTHLTRDVLQGTPNQVRARLLRRSLTWLVVWLLIALAVHALAWHLAGRPWLPQQPAERVSLQPDALVLSSAAALARRSAAPAPESRCRPA